MKNKLIILIVFITIISCNKINVFNTQETNNCNFDIPVKKITDIRENYSIDVPKNWKRSFYVDENSSVLRFADTTLNLDQADVLEVGFYKGNLKVGENTSEEWINKLITDNNAKLIKSEPFEYKKLKSVFLLYQFDFYNLKTNKYETFIRQNSNEYFRISLTSYGSQNNKERLCNAIHIFNSLELKPEL